MVGVWHWWLIARVEFFEFNIVVVVVVGSE